MRRVFTTFADWLPSHGLLLLRVIVASALLARSVEFADGDSLKTLTPHLIAAGAGLFLLLGLRTPIAGAFVALIELFIIVSHNHDPLLSLLLGSVSIALALLGPGNWSIDARRSGWKRIEIRPPDA